MSERTDTIELVRRAQQGRPEARGDLVRIVEPRLAEYVGRLTERERPFRGPQTSEGRPGCSTLLISDYFGFNHWRSPEAFGSCEQLPKAQVTTSTPEAVDYWFSRPAGEPDKACVQVTLRAGFVDGHVETYCPAETTVLEVGRVGRDGGVPPPLQTGRADFPHPAFLKISAGGIHRMRFGSGLR